jgi:hypothetical protein
MYKTTIFGLDVINHYNIHKAIAAYFHEAQHIWRCDGTTAIVYSAELPKGELTLGMSCGSKEVAALVSGDVFPALLRVNACKHTGERYVPLQDQEIQAWLPAHLPGFEVTSAQFARVKSVMHKTTDTATHRITLSGYDVSAVLEVVDAEKATATMAAGVGRGRRLGFGLILPLA